MKVQNQLYNISLQQILVICQFYKVKQKYLMIAESIQDYHSKKTSFQDTKTQAETDYHLNSRRISTEHVPYEPIHYSDTQRKSFDRVQLPSIQLSRENRTLSLSHRLHQGVQKLIEQEISKGKISVPQNQTTYRLKRKQKLVQKPIDPEIKMKQKLIEMEQKRLQTIQMLKLIQDQQIEIKRQSVSIKFNKKSHQKSDLKKQRSHYSPQQKRAVRKMLMRQNILEKQINQKTQNFKKHYFNSIQTQRQRYATQIEKEKSLHRSFIQQNKKNVQQKKLQRLQSIESGKKKYQQVKNKRYFYQNLQQEDEKVALQELDDLNKKLQAIKSKMKVTIVEELKQHKEKYNEIMKSRTAAMSMEKSTYFCENSQLSLAKKIEQNYFTKLTKEQRQTKKKQQEIAKSKVFQLKQKVKIFSNHCDNQIRPKIKITSRSKFVPMESHRSVHSLNYFQQQKKGHQYLSAAKRLKKCQTLQDQKVLNNKGLQIFQTSPYKAPYKNYLNQMRRNSQSNPQQSDRKKFSTFLDKQGSISEYNTLHKAFIVAQSIQAKSKRSKNQKLIDSVQNKIKLLKMII